MVLFNSAMYNVKTVTEWGRKIGTSKTKFSPALFVRPIKIRTIFEIQPRTKVADSLRPFLIAKFRCALLAPYNFLHCLDMYKINKQFIDV